jgi:hypothetical protein
MVWVSESLPDRVVRMEVWMVGDFGQRRQQHRTSESRMRGLIRRRPCEEVSRRVVASWCHQGHLGVSSLNMFSHMSVMMVYWLILVTVCEFETLWTNPLELMIITLS